MELDLDSILLAIYTVFNAVSIYANLMLTVVEELGERGF